MDKADKLFNDLMDWGMGDPEMPDDVVEALDKVADYLGDIAKGRSPAPSAHK